MKRQGGPTALLKNRREAKEGKRLGENGECGAFQMVKLGD